MVSWKNVLGTSVLTAGLIFGSLGPVGNLASAKTSKDATHRSHITANFQNKEGTVPLVTKSTGGPFDLGLVNEDRVKDLLIRQGIVDKNASAKTQNLQMQNYLNKRAKSAEAKGTDLQEMKQLRSKLQKQAGLPLKAPGVAKKDTTTVKKGGKYTSVDSIQRENWNGPVREDKILVLLIDFPDLPHGQVSEEDNPVLLYKGADAYSRQHYQDMIFGDNGYTGPDGQHFISLKQFYEQQSGGSYTVSGTVAGWYTAKHNADYYGGNYPDDSGSDRNPRALIAEALAAAAADGVNLSEYDIEDQFDLDGDGNYREPDGIIDHLMVVHSGVGEEAGGGKLGPDAIWSHSWDLGGAYVIPGTAGQSQAEYDISGNHSLMGYAYTVEPEDGAAGVFAHEYGHNLGLPDDYDTNYSHNSVGEPVGYWSIMSSGSWGGLIPGTEPTGFAPKDKEFLQENVKATVNGELKDLNWFHDVVLNYDDLKNGTQVLKLDEASVKGTNADGVRINLPDKETVVNTPTSGQYEYYGGGVNNATLSMTTSEPIDLTNAKSAQLTFNTWYSIEQDFDYAYVSVSIDNGKTWNNIAGNITTTDDPNDANLGNGITGDSNGWKEAVFDLSAYVGQNILLKFSYVGDPYVTQAGFYVDDISVVADGQKIFSDDAESDSSPFNLDGGFEKSNGKKYTEQYYLVEWRNYADADTALAHIARGNSVMTYDPGMVVWYVDNYYTDNWVGEHPGDGFLGVVDAHQVTASWNDLAPKDGVDAYGPAGTSYQIQDAAFSLSKTDEMYLDYSYLNPGSRDLYLKSQPAIPTFDDSRDYSNKGQIYAGRNIPKLGLKIHVVGQAEDMSVGEIAVHVGDVDTLTLNPLKTEVYSSKDGHNKVKVSGTVHNDGNGEKITVTYELVNAEGKVVLSKTKKLLGLYQNFKHTFTLPEDLQSGDYKVVVTASDVDGNKKTAETNIKVDNVAPVIKLKGDNPLVIKQGSEYKEPGYTATDNVDGDLTGSVKVTGTVNVHTVGEYTLTYSVTDSTGNTASVTRTVKVEKADTDNGGTDNGGTGNGGTDNNGGKGGTVDNGSGSGGSGSSNTGGNLPSTSTNMFNYMTAGLVSLFIALALWLAQRKRRKSVVQ